MFGSYYFWGIDIYYFILVVPALIFSLIMQAKVKGAFRRFSVVENRERLTGAMAAQNVLNHYGITDVRIEHVRGDLTDHYSPKEKVIRLSDGVFNSTSVAAVGIACHEAGHAAQHAQKYVPIKIRNAILPVCNIGSALGLPLAIIGLIFEFEALAIVGLILFSFVAVFQFATLPVEFNASRRAMQVIEQTNMLSSDEAVGAKKVLSAAAMTYVAALAVSIANLLRLLLRFNRNNNR